MTTKRRKRARQTRRDAVGRRARDPWDMDTVAIEIADPEAPRSNARITVRRQLRSDPLARLHNRAQIDEAQYAAGRSFQRDCQTAERGTRAIDPRREKVDGGTRDAAITDVHVRARKRLIALERVLGRTMHRVVHAVLVEGMSMEVVAQRLFAREGEAAAKYYGRLFRDALDVLAVEYGLKRIPPPRYPQYSA